MSPSATKQRKQRTLAVEQLEDKDLLTAFLGIDFNGATRTEISSMCRQVSCNRDLQNSTSGAPSFLGTFSALNGSYSRYSFLDFDNNGRRSGIDRRQFTYAMHIPERRLDDNRRNQSDRRTKPRT